MRVQNTFDLARQSFKRLALFVNNVIAVINATHTANHMTARARKKKALNPTKQTRSSPTIEAIRGAHRISFREGRGRRIASAVEGMPSLHDDL